MKRALILAYYYPPIAASGSLRPLGFSNHLNEHGYIPKVISTDIRDAHPPVSIDSSLERLLKPEIRVERLCHVNYLKVLLAFRERLRSMKRTDRPVACQPNNHSNQSDDERLGKFSLVRQLKVAVLNRLFLFPDHQKPWIKAVLRYIGSINRSEYPDLVYATGNPWSALVAGQQVAKKLKIPLIVDFRDPWTRNPKAPVSDSLGRKALALERSVLESADRVITNTEELRQAFIHDHPDLESKFITITNGYNDLLLSEIKNISPRSNPLATIELCHFGSIYELRNPLKLLQAVRELVAEEKVHKGDLILRFIGIWLVEDGHCNQIAEMLEADGYVTREQPLAHEDYLTSMMSSQHLLILQQDFPLQIPGKIYEYIATGRPLIIVGGEGATANLVSRYGLGIAFLNDVEALKDSLIRLVEGRLSIKGAEASQIEQFSYSTLTTQLAAIFDQAILEYN